PHQHQRAERAQAPPQAPDAGLRDFLAAADPGQSDLRRRRIDPYDSLSLPLEVDGVPAWAAADVEDPTADCLHRLALDLRPLRGSGEVRLDEGAAAVPVIPLEFEDDLLSEPVVQHRLRIEI